jgi:hypothetical protein
VAVLAVDVGDGGDVAARIPSPAIVVDVLAERLADFDQRISSVVGQVAEQMEGHGKMLGEILGRLSPR